MISDDPAFPTTPVSHGYDPSSPGNGTGCGTGLTKKELFAAMMMQTMIEKITPQDLLRDGPDECLELAASMSIQAAQVLIGKMNFRHEAGENQNQKTHNES